MGATSSRLKKSLDRHGGPPTVWTCLCGANSTVKDENVTTKTKVNKYIRHPRIDQKRPLRVSRDSISDSRLQKIRESNTDIFEVTLTEGQNQTRIDSLLLHDDDNDDEKTERKQKGEVIAAMAAGHRKYYERMSSAERIEARERWNAERVAHRQLLKDICSKKLLNGAMKLVNGDIDSPLPPIPSLMTTPTSSPHRKSHAPGRAEPEAGVNVAGWSKMNEFCDTPTTGEDTIAAGRYPGEERGSFRLTSHSTTDDREILVT